MTTDYRKPPPRIWWYRPGQWRGLLPTTSSDEWGRHTLVLPTILFGTVIIPFKNCDCDDEMRDFACVTDGCPYMAMSPGSQCISCDPPEDDDYDEADCA